MDQKIATRVKNLAFALAQSDIQNFCSDNDDLALPRDEVRDIANEAAKKAISRLRKSNPNEMGDISSEWCGELVEEVVQKLESSFMINGGEVNSVVNPDADHQSWYPQFLQSNDNPDERWLWYRESLQRTGWAPLVIDGINKSATEIVDLLGDPSSVGDFQRKGMVIGHVQSGKTACMAAVLAKAIDAGYRDVIILAGAWNNLREQTQKRFEHDVVGYRIDRDPDTGQLKSERVGVGRNRKAEKFRSLAVLTGRKSDFNAAAAMSFASMPQFEDGSTRMFVVKKNISILKTLRNYLELHSLSGRPALVLDDECDHYSLNTNNKDPEDPTKTNRSIRDLLAVYNQASYVGFTATPYANIFIDPFVNSSEYGMDLFPKDFITCLSPPSNYVGARQLFGDHENRGDGTFRIIDDARPWMPPDFENKARVKEECLPESLREAIRGFILGVACRHARGDTAKPSSMLVHVSRFVDAQSQVADQVNGVLQNYLTDLELSKAGDGGIWDQLMSDWTQEFLPKSEELYSHDSKNFSKPVPWKEIERRLQLISNQHRSDPVFSVRKANSKSEGDVDWEKMGGKAAILVGGDKLSRGITLEGLITSYFIKDTKKPSYDTTLQMGRWFGYRDGWRDVCRLYTGRRNLRHFRAISVRDDDVRSQIMGMGPGMTPLKVGLFVATHPEMMITSAAKLGARGRLQTISYWGRTNSVLHYSRLDEDRVANFNALSSLLSGPIDGRQEGAFRVFLGLTREAILSFLVSYREPSAPESPATKTSGIRENLMAKEAEPYATSWSVAVHVGKGKGARFGLEDFPTLIDKLKVSQLNPITRSDNNADSFRESPIHIQSLSGSAERRLDLKALAKSGDSVFPFSEEDVNKMTDEEVVANRRSSSGFIIIHPFRPLGPEPSMEKEKTLPCIAVTLILPRASEELSKGQSVRVNPVFEALEFSGGTNGV